MPINKVQLITNLLFKTLVIFCLLSTNYSISYAENAKLIADEPSLPSISRLLAVGDTKLQVSSVRSQQYDAKGTLILLSGPTDYWYADSAWFSLLQPMLAQNYHVHAIERPGVGFSKDADDMSYGSLATYLSPTIKALSNEKVIIIAYASANLSLWPWLAKQENHNLVKGIVLIDPDVLQPHSINQYKGDAKPFRDNFEKYYTYLSEGKYTERTNGFIEKETKHVNELISNAHNQYMNWSYFNQMMRMRKTIRAQLNKLIEVANYGTHLDRAFAAGDPTAIPLYIIDTDFESAYIKANPDNQSLAIWQAEGTHWFKDLAKNSKGYYQALEAVDHLVPIAAPEVIIKAVKKLNGD